MHFVEGTIIAGRFRLIRELGKGGMGTVWLAQHLGLDTPCAIKFIHAEAAALVDVRSRFEREAKAAAQLRSTHVVQILDYGLCSDCDDGAAIPYIAMEYLQGEDLSSRLTRCGVLPPIETANIVLHIARALTKAHAAGLVHRDLKPENVFITRDDDQEIAKVLDFGIAKSYSGSVGDASTRTGSMVGTPYYMSPEQAQGTKAVDHRSDLWALGVLAFRCLTGKLPFMSEALGDLLLQIIVNPMPTPSHANPSLPPSFDAWWARACSRDPAQRFQTAKELSDSLFVALGISSSTGVKSQLSFDSLSMSSPDRMNSPPLAFNASPVQISVSAKTQAIVETNEPFVRSASESEPAPQSQSRNTAVVVIAAGVLLAVGALGVFALAKNRYDSSSASSPVANATASMVSMETSTSTVDSITTQSQTSSAITTTTSSKTSKGSYKTGGTSTKTTSPASTSKNTSTSTSTKNTLTSTSTQKTSKADDLGL